MYKLSQLKKQMSYLFFTALPMHAFCSSGCGLVVEHLPSMCETLGSSSSMVKEIQRCVFEDFDLLYLYYNF
jgi:hypothetical protein